MKKRIVILLCVLLSVIVCIGAICFSYFGMYSNHRPKKSGTAESALVFDRPDEIVKFVNGKEKKCSAEEIDGIYNAFMATVSEVRIVYAEKQPLTQSYVRKKKKTTEAFEFRYFEKRNLNAVLEYKKSDFSDYGTSYVFENNLFDAVFVSLGSDSLFFALHSDKQYQGNSPMYMDVGRDAVLALSKEIF